MGDITFTAQTRFQNNLRLELDQHKSLLGSRCVQRNQAGAEKEKFENLISNSKAQTKTGRYSAVTYNTTGWDGIWIAKPEAKFWAELLDNDDRVVTGVDLQGGLVMQAHSAMNRADDDTFLEGFFGDMITGKTGTVLNAFPAANVVDVTHDGAGGAVAIGMKAAKLRRARKILAENFVNMDQAFYIALAAEQIENLFAETTVMSSDYHKANAIRFSADGKSILGACGFEFIEIELGNPMLDQADLTLTADPYRKNPFWTADGMVMNAWETLFTSVDRLPQNHHNIQVYARSCKAASRTDQNRCGYIENDEA